MSIQILNINELQSALQKMWQQDLGTTEDPANGQWYTSGANGDSIGLYGGLTDTAPSQLTFNTAAQVFLPSQITCSTAIMDNRNGLNPTGTASLSYSYTNGSSYTQTTTSSINTTTSVGFEVSASFEGVGASASANFSVDIGYSLASSNGTSNSTTQTFSQEVDVTVPTGKVYQVALTATVQKIQVPYTCAIQVSGTTETWFEDPVNGHYNWTMAANQAFNLINTYGTAGSDSASYGYSGSNGTVTVSGTLSAQQTVNFIANVYDVTDTYTSSDAPSNSTTPATTLAISQPVKRLATPGTPPVQGKLVKTIHF